MCVKKHTERGRQDRINNKRNEKKKELGHWKIRSVPKNLQQVFPRKKGGLGYSGHKKSAFQQAIQVYVYTNTCLGI